MAIGDRLRALREEKGMSREQVADKLGLSYWAVAKYEGNKRNPDPEIIKKYADFFDVSVDYIYEREAKAKNDTFGPELLEYLEKSKDLRIGGHTLNDSQRKIVIDFFKEVIAKNLDSRN